MRASQFLLICSSLFIYIDRFVLDHRDLSRFIAAGRIHATIDKVHGIVETNRPEAKSAQYETVVKQGDILLNKIQRLSKVLY